MTACILLGDYKELPIAKQPGTNQMFTNKRLDKCFVLNGTLYGNKNERFKFQIKTEGSLTHFLANNHS